MQYFYLKNHDGYLSVMNEGQHKHKLTYSRHSVNLDVTDKVIAFCLSKYPKKLFLCSMNQKEIKLNNRPFISTVFPVGIESGITPHMISLYDLQDHSWISIPPFNDAVDVGEFKINYDIHLCGLVASQLSWEEIRLEDVDHRDIPSWVKNVALSFNELYVEKPDVESIKRVMSSYYYNEVKQNIINSFYPSMGIKELDNIVIELKKSIEFKQRFIQIFQNDFWIKDVLKNLFEWESNRTIKSVIHCSQKYDVLQNYYTECEFSSISHAINCSYRRNIAPTKKTCVVTTIRNEGIYILEWVSWYKKLGFEHLFIFSNNNDDGSDDLLQSLADAGVITWIKNDIQNNIMPQAKMCKYTYTVLPDILDYEWCLMVDMDEFLSINRGLFNDIGGLIEWVEKNEVDVVGFNWQYTSSYDSLDIFDHFITDRIQYYVNDSVIGMANSMIKSMSRPRYVISSTAHHVIWSNKYHVVYRLIQGDIHKNNDLMWASHSHRGIANIIHYHYKTPIEHLLKLYRGNALNGFHQKGITMEMFNESQLYHFNQQHLQYGDKILGHFVFNREGISEIFNKLLDLPNVRKSYQNTILQTKEKVKEILSFMYEHEAELGEQTYKLFEYIKKISK